MKRIGQMKVILIDGHFDQDCHDFSDPENIKKVVRVAFSMKSWDLSIEGDAGGVGERNWIIANSWLSSIG